MDKIYVIRDEKVMIDRDLAILYDVKSIRLREQVKRNKEKFPKHFMFQLSENEVESMVSQNAIPSKKHLGGALPHAFTEHGILQLASVLRSERANKMSIKIIEVFVKMRKILLNNKELLIKLEQMEKSVTKNSKDVKLIFTALKQLIKTPNLSRKEIGFKQNE